MGDRQIYFGLGVGLLVALLGVLIVFISQAGWNMLVVGLALSSFSVMVKLYNKSATAATKGGDEDSVKALSALPAKSRIREGDYRDAA